MPVESITIWRVHFAEDQEPRRNQREGSGFRPQAVASKANEIRPGTL